MATTLGEAIITIRAEDKNLDRDLSKTKSKTKKWAEGVGGIMKTAFGFAIGNMIVGGVQNITAGIGNLITEAAGFEQTSKTFDKLVQSVGGDVPDALKQLKTATRGMVAENDLVLAGNKFLAMGLAETTEEAAVLAEMATQLGMAMGEDATASMENFALMLANQSIPRLDSFGMSSGKVREDINRLMAADKSLTREQAFMTAVMEAGRETMEKVGDQSKGTAGNMARLDTFMGDLKMTIGTALLPVMNALLEPIGELAQTYGPMLTEWAQGFSEWLQSEGIPAIQTWGAELWEKIQPALVSLGEVIGDVIIPLLQEWIPILVENLIPTFQMMAGFWMNIAETVLPLLGDAIAFVSDNFEIIGPIIAAVGIIILALTSPLSLVVGAVIALEMAWANNWGGIRDWVEGIWTKLQPALAAIWEFIDTKIIPILRMLWDFIVNFVKKEVEALAWVWENILMPALRAVWEWIDAHLLPLLAALGRLLVDVILFNVENMAYTWETILLPALRTVWEFIDQNILPIFRDLADMLEGPLSAAFDFLTETILPGVIGAFQTFFDLLGWIVDTLTRLIELLDIWGSKPKPTGAAVTSGAGGGGFAAGLGGAGEGVDNRRTFILYQPGIHTTGSAEDLLSQLEALG